MERPRERMELERLRAVEDEKTKWEAREDRLATLVQQLQQQLVAPPRHLSGSHPAPTAVTTVHFAPETVTPMATTMEPLTGMSATWTVGGEGEGGGGEVSGSLLVESSSGDTAGGGEGAGGGGNLSGGGRVASDGGTNPCSITSLAALPLVAQQLPPISKFTGETSEGGETVVEWLEQLELVAAACCWDEPTKLVNLVTRLKGQAFAVM